MFFRPDLYLAGFIILILKECMENEGRNTTRWVCAGAIPLALRLG
ncbi:type VI secretion system-associated lipoprotein, partial [Salmonella enterica]